MKLSNDTVAILKNFATINQNLQFQPGNVIKTRTRSSEVFATATVTEDFPSAFAIYELGRFLSVLQLFSDPDLEFGDSSVKISDGRTAVDYVFADPSLINGADYVKVITLPPVIATFDLRQDDIAKLQKAASVLGNPTVSISAVNGKLVVSSHDKKNPSCDKYALDIGTTDSEDFVVDLALESLRFIPGDYVVDVSERIACKFTNSATAIEYLVAGTISR